MFDSTGVLSFVTHFIASCIPNKPSPLLLKSPIKSKPYRILPTPPNSGPKASPIPSTILLNNAPMNWSAIQGVKLTTLFRKEVNSDVISGNKLLPTVSNTQGNFFCIFATAGIIAVCAAVPAFLAKAVF